MGLFTAMRVFEGAILLATAFLPSFAERKQCAIPQLTTDPLYRAGQVWSYRTRPGETSSTITILQVESTSVLGTIIHVRIDGIHLNNCKGRPSPTTIEHAPFAKTAIDRSVTGRLHDTSKLPEYEAGYRDWLAHCGGVYTISVAEMVKVDDQTFNAGLSCST